MDPATLNCTLTPDTTEGPYWVDERLKRRDVTEDQTGVPLKLTLGVYEADPACSPYPGAVVDIWQANALGLYSDQPEQPRADTGGQTFLRGCQASKENGEVKFQTIYPGWYEGRTLHIHVRVRTFSTIAKTDGDLERGLAAAFRMRLAGLPPAEARGEPGHWALAKPSLRKGRRARPARPRLLQGVVVALRPRPRKQRHR